MVAKEFLLFSLFCGTGFTPVALEEREQRSQCRKQRVFCPCKDRRGMTGHVLVVTCSDQSDPNNSLCKGEALFSEECGKVNFSSKRHRRDSGNCINGIIPGSPHTLDKDPQAMIRRSRITRKVDDSPTFECQVYSNFSANVTWLFNGKPLETNKWKHSFKSCKRYLKVNYIEKSDAGNYTCVVTNEKGKQASAPAELSVYVLVKSRPAIESAGLEHGDTAYIGTAVNITCNFRSSDPLITGSVWKDGKKLEEDDEQLKHKHDYSNPNPNPKPEKDMPTLLLTKLEIKNNTKEDVRNYTCQTNAYSWSLLKAFHFKVNITCNIRSSDPLVNGSVWTNGKKLKEDNEQPKYKYHHLTVKDKPSLLLTKLEIKNITREDAGNYMCQANAYGLRSLKAFHLKVEPCPAGFYCPPGGSGRIQCPQGTYQPNISQTSEQACKPCPAGFYCPPKATGPIQCPLGTYQPKMNQTSRHICQQCPPGFYCPPGASGHIQCPPGTYQPSISQTSEQACKPCPAGFYCPPKATGPIQCPLGTYQPKMYQKSRHICRQCLAGFYCPPGGSNRIQCPQGTYQPSISQTSEQACKPCQAGFYCPPKATGPIQCPLGTYQPKMNQTSRHICRQCPPGFYCPPGASGRIQCPQGTYQPNNSQTSEKACKSCPLFTNSLKNLGRGPILDEADCPEENPNKDITKIVIGTASGVAFITVVVFLLLFFAKKKHLLWFSSLGPRHDPECYTSQPMLNGDTENAEGAEVFKKSPEIDYEAKHDVFICYCYKDVDWVKELLAELEKRGFKCCIDFKTFTIGIPIMQNITEAICFSKKTIAVLSPDFIKSDWCKHELQKALSRVRYHQVVPVMYKNCEIPIALQDTTYLDWENCNVKPYFWEQLEKALRKPNGESYKSRRPQNGNQTS